MQDNELLVRIDERVGQLVKTAQDIDARLETLETRLVQIELRVNVLEHSKSHLETSLSKVLDYTFKLVAIGVGVLLAYVFGIKG